MSEALNELGIYFNVSAGDSNFKRLFTAAVRTIIEDEDDRPRSDEQELIDKLHERLMYHENKHAFFNMGRFPQVGDRIQDLSMESKPLATIIALSVLSNGHAVASVSYDDAEIKGTRFNFCNHGSTWQMLYDAPRAKKEVCAENEVARTAQEYHNALEAILQENFSGDHSECLESLNRICDIAKNALT